VSRPTATPPRIEIPRWVQLVGLPLLVLFAWVVAMAAGHAVVLFLIASLIALLLDPIVSGLTRLRVRRGIAVAIVYLSFLGVLVVAIAAIGTVLVGQTQTAGDRFNAYFTAVDGRTEQAAADRDVERLQRWFDTHHLKGIKVQERGHDLVRQVRERDVGKYTERVVDFMEGAAISIGKGVFSAVLILVISIDMLLDMPRLHRFVDRRLPPQGGDPCCNGSKARWRRTSAARLCSAGSSGRPPGSGCTPTACSGSCPEWRRTRSCSAPGSA
jgi:predicted PurR-regulated permease PerM